MDIVRPCFIVVDREYSGSISTRKLVIETAKFNVLTAYSAREGIETLKRFPAVDGLVMNAEIHDMERDELIGSLRRIRPAMPIVVVDGSWGGDSSKGDHQVESFDPAQLLETLRGICLKQTAAIEQPNEELSEQE